MTEGLGMELVGNMFEELMRRIRPQRYYEWRQEAWETLEIPIEFLGNKQHSIYNTQLFRPTYSCWGKKWANSENTHCFPL